MLAVQNAFLLQDFQRLPQSGTADLEEFCQFMFRGYSIPSAVSPLLEYVEDCIPDLKGERPCISVHTNHGFVSVSDPRCSSSNDETRQTLNTEGEKRMVDLSDI